MRSLTSLHESRVYSPENFWSPVQKDFCNNIPQKADIRLTLRHVCLVPKTGLMHRNKRLPRIAMICSITSSARPSNIGEITPSAGTVTAGTVNIGAFRADLPIGEIGAHLLCVASGWITRTAAARGLEHDPGSDT